MIASFTRQSYESHLAKSREKPDGEPDAHHSPDVYSDSEDEDAPNVDQLWDMLPAHHSDVTPLSPEDSKQWRPDLEVSDHLRTRCSFCIGLLLSYQSLTVR